MEGFLLVNKPSGISSFGVVAVVRSIISKELGKKIKVGHAGTLDPAAKGLMIIAVGSYTKKIPLLITKDKQYKVVAKLGEVSTTGDIEGDIEFVSDAEPDTESVKRVLHKYIGLISQVPPRFSAIKINGKRAYKLARDDKEFIMPSRTITINKLELIKYKYPLINFTVDVSSGTYIRSLAEDIGKDLQTGAYVVDLLRTKVGQYNLKDSIDLDKLNFAVIKSELIK